MTLPLFILEMIALLVFQAFLIHKAYSMIKCLRARNFYLGKSMHDCLKKEAMPKQIVNPDAFILPMASNVVLTIVFFLQVGILKV
jgi:hypothetical protein